MRARAARATRGRRSTMMCRSERCMRRCSRVPIGAGPTSDCVGPTSDRPGTNLSAVFARRGPTSQPRSTPDVRVRTRACAWREVTLPTQVGLRRENKAFWIGPTSDQPPAGRSCARRSVPAPSTVAVRSDGSSPGRVYCGPPSREIAPRREEILRLIRAPGVNRTGGGR